MTRPTTKNDLLQLANMKNANLWDLINSMTDKEQRAPFNFDVEIAGKEAHWKRDKNIKDVLIHVYEWHELLLNWVKANQNNENKPFLPEPYNWKSYGQMNVEFVKKHQDTSYETSIELLKQSHIDVMNLIEKFSSDELFEKNQFSWTKTSTLGSYCVSATASHYEWAIKKIKKQIKHMKTLMK